MSKTVEYHGDPTLHVNRQGVPQMERASVDHFEALAIAAKAEGYAARRAGNEQEVARCAQVMRRYHAQAEEIRERHRKAGYKWAR